MKVTTNFFLVFFLVFSLSAALNSQEAENFTSRSPIEKTFLASGEESGEELCQFGYDLFISGKAKITVPTTIPVTGEYTLGTGDEIVIHLWGLLEEEYRVKIDRDGNIFLPRLGKLTLAGKAFQEAETLIKERLQQFYKNVLVDVALENLRTVKVFVVGEVREPGSYEIYAFSSLIDALQLAGGIRKTGSLRDIKIMREGEEIASYDLYPLLLYGRTEEFKLMNGDTIFVSPVGRVAAITGNVKRPAIFELKGETSLTDLIDMAGGLMPSAYLPRVQIVRIEDFKSRVILDKELSPPIQRSQDKILIKDGDLVKIFSIDKRIYNRVSLEGMVRHPGDYELKPMMKLNDILSEEELLPEANREIAEIIRLKEDGTVETFSFSPQDLLAGGASQDVALKRWDRIVIRSAWPKVKKANISGEVRIPGEYTIRENEKLSSLIERSGGFTEQAFLKGAVFIRKSVKEKQKRELLEFIERKRAQLEKQKTSATEELIAIGKGLLDELSGKEPIGRVMLHLDELEKFKDSQDDLILEDGDHLYIPKPPQLIYIMGEVNQPGAIPYRKGANLHYYLKKAGGFTRNADRRNLFIIRADGTATKRVTSIEEGSTIVVPQYIPTRIGKIIGEIVEVLYKTTIIGISL